jgi:hypothetical protein
MQAAMFYRYIKEEKIDNDIKKFVLNLKDGLMEI